MKIVLEENSNRKFRRTDVTNIFGPLEKKLPRSSEQNGSSISRSTAIRQAIRRSETFGRQGARVLSSALKYSSVVPAKFFFHHLVNFSTKRHDSHLFNMGNNGCKNLFVSQNTHAAGSMAADY